MVASPERLRPARSTRGGGQAPPRPRAPADARAGLHHARRSTTRRAARVAARRARDIQPPHEDTEYPYFTSWVKQQVVDKLGGGQAGARRAFEGGLTVQTTLDSRLQDAAQTRDQPVAAVRRTARARRSSRSTTSTGEVLRDGRRRRLPHAAVQPRHAGPAPAGLGVQAVRARRGADARASRPNSVWDVAEASYCVTPEEGHVQGELRRQQLQRRLRRRDAPSRTATTFSDNSVYAQVGIQVGTQQDRPARAPDGHPHAGLAQLRDDARRPASRASRRSTWRTPTRRSRTSGRLTYGTMSPGARSTAPAAGAPARSGIRAIGTQRRRQAQADRAAERRSEAINRRATGRCSKPSVAATRSTSMLAGRRHERHRRRARRSPACSWPARPARPRTTATPGSSAGRREITVAVWVGYPDKLRPMETRVHGRAGGRRHLSRPGSGRRSSRRRSSSRATAQDEEDKGKDGDGDGVPDAPSTTVPSTPGTTTEQPTTPAPQTTAPTGEGGGDDAQTAPAPQQAPAQQAPAQQAPAQQAPAQTTPPAQQPAPSTGGAAPPG